MADDAIDTLFSASGWNEVTLQVAFVQGLAENIMDELAVRDPPEGLKELYALAIRLDTRLREVAGTPVILPWYCTHCAAGPM